MPLPRFLRRSALFSLFAGAMALSAHADAALSFESNTYRSGHDILARTDAPSPTACAVDCSLVDGCRAWSYAEVCELRPAMGMSSRASGAESGLYFPGVGHIAFRSANLDVFDNDEPVPSLLRLSDEPQKTEAEEPITATEIVTALVETTSKSDDPYAPRQFASWSFATGGAPSSSNGTLDGFDSGSNNGSSYDSGLPPGAVEENGVVYLDSDEDIDDDFYALRP